MNCEYKPEDKSMNEANSEILDTLMYSILPILISISGKIMIDETGCDGFMIGRAALGNPWIFNGTIPSDKEKIDMIKKHYRFLKNYFGEKRALLEIRTHALWYLKGISGVKQHKNLITNCKNEEEFFNVLDEIMLTICNKNDKLDA